MEELDFSIPGRERKVERSHSRLLFILIVIGLIILLANTAILLLFNRSNKNPSQDTVLSSENQKQLALKLEKQGLNNAAADAWKEYLITAPINPQEAARIWYRIGKIHMQDHQYDMALSAFYRSESFAKPDDISSEVTRSIQECLESMGRFAALRYELSDRADSDAVGGDESSDVSRDPVVAEIGPQKIMKSSLDRRIEYLIETQISQFAAYLSEDQIRKQKEELLKQYSTDSQRRLFLNQYIAEELLYRNAIKQGLIDSPEIKAQLKDIERTFLAEKLLKNMYSQNIKMTQVDLENFFEANKKKYIQPKRIKIGHILVKDEEESLEIRKRLENGEHFEYLAKEFSLDRETREGGGELSGWIEKDKTKDIAGIEVSETAMNTIFSTEKGKIVNEDIKSEKGLHIIKVLEKENERQLNFSEVKDRVAFELRSRKEQEVREKLLERLKKEYDVIIHHSAFSEGIPKTQE